MNTVKSKTVTLREIDKEPNEPILYDTSLCSCAKCDSFNCFHLRNKEQCSCKKCRGNEACVSCEKKNVIGENRARHFEIPDTDSVVKERVKKEITYEYSNNNNNLSIVKKQSKFSFCTTESRDIEQAFVNDKIVTSEKIPHAHSATVIYSRKGFDSNTAELSAQIMNVPFKDFKASVSYNKSDSSPKSTKLTKLDIFKRIKEAYKACSCKVCECIVGKTPARNEYCKCKPCECNECADFVKKLDNKVKFSQLYFAGCPCIRCNNTNCKGVTKNANGPVEFCDCDPCDCLKCKDSVSAQCDCKPCECIECKSYAVSEPRTTNTFVVASMREDEPRNYCQCSPCDCAECGQHYLMNSSLRHEIATGISRPANCACDNCMSQSCQADDGNPCSCEVQRGVMRKPFEKDTHDYDIHRASIKKIGISEIRTRNDPITMFAAIKNNYPGLDVNNKTFCSCGDCECIVCSCQNNNAASMPCCFTSPKEDQKTPRMGACNCAPCECEICNKNVRGYTKPDRSISIKKCDCSICDCLQCDGLLQPSLSNSRNCITAFQCDDTLTSNACKCSPCECTDCQKMMFNCTGDNCFCGNCKCQMCSDHNKFIHETVYRTKPGTCQLPLTLGTQFKNEYNNTSGILQNQKNSKSLIAGEELKNNNKSRQNVSVNLISSDIEKLNVNPVKNGNIRSISKSSPQGVQEIVNEMTQSIHFSQEDAQFQDRKVVMQYCDRNAANNGSSSSFVSENLETLDKKSFDISKKEIINIMPRSCELSDKQSIKSVTGTSNGNNTVSKYLNDQIICDVNFKDSKCAKESFKPTINGPIKDDTDNYSGLKFNCANYITIDKNNHDHYSKNVSLKSQDEPAVVELPGSCLNSDDLVIDSKNKKRITLENEMASVKRTSFKLLESLRDANKRLSNLMQTKISEHNLKIRPSKRNVPLSNTLITELIKKINAPSSDIRNASHDQTLQIDYDKLKTTLQQAQYFSDELMNALNEYKKENQKRVCRKTVNDEINLVDLNCDPMKKYGFHNLNIKKMELEKSECEDNLMEKNDYKVKNEQLHDSRGSSHVVLKSADSVQDLTEITSDNNNNLQPVNDHMGISAGSTSKSQHNEYNARSQLNEKPCNQKTEDRRRPHSENRSPKYVKKCHVTRSDVLYKRLKLKEALQNLAETANFTNISTPTHHISERSIKEIFVPTKDITEKTENKQETTSTSTHTKDERARCEHEQLQVTESEVDIRWSILRKNCLIGLSNDDRRGFPIIPPLQLEIKDTLRTISNLHWNNGRSEIIKEAEMKRIKDVTIQSSAEFTANKNIGKSKLDLQLQVFIAASSQTYNMTNTVEKAVDCMDDTFSVVVLKRQIQELLNMSITQPPNKNLLNVDVENSGRIAVKTKPKTKSFNDPLKAKFVSLRRVSDHTVLVKWKAPLHVNHVEGYELLVDGRAVQKIISPSRCMAVVSCLPRAEKVLITLRTMVSSAVQCAHYPFTTVVYHMRAK